jgi:hypothetical protein
MGSINRKRIAITTKNAAIVEGIENSDAVRQIVIATVKRFYSRGKHANSLKNLKPRRKRMQSESRRKARPEQSAERIGMSAVRFWVEKSCEETEKTERLLARSVREHLGISLKELERQMYGR